MRRYTLILIVTLIAFMGSITALFATQQERDFELRGYVDATRESNLPYFQPRLGVNAELTQYAAAELPHHFDLMQQAHIIWVRQVFRWDEIESEQGVFDWEQWDTVVTAIADYPDLEIVAVIVNTPIWARTALAAENATAPPDDPAYLADFAAALAERYGDIIDYYQIWDEPNLTAAWGNLNPQPAHYTAILQAAYTAIHAADESATVISAALAPTTETGPENIRDDLYLRALFAYGAGDYMDAIATKPYGFDMPPDDRTVDVNTLNFSRIILIREEMVRAGYGTTPLWASYWGWNSLPENRTGEPSIWGNVSAAQQSEYTIAAIERAEREWPWLGPMILYHWQPDALADNPVWGFSLLNPDGQPTPLWEALTTYQPPAVAQNGLYHPVTRHARYSGVWTFSELGADIGWINDSQLEFDFAGTDIALLLREDNYVAYLYPTVDGQRPNALPTDTSGNGYIILRSNSLAPERNLVPVARGLPNTPHTLRITTDELDPIEAEDRWALAGYAVSSGNLAAPYNTQITLALLTAIIAAVSATITALQLNWRPAIQQVNVIWQRLSYPGQIIFGAVTSIALMLGMLLTWGDSTPAILRREPVQLGIAIATGGLVYLNFHVILTLVALVLLFIAIYNRIELGLYLTLFYAPFFLWPVELYLFAFPMAEILILLTTAAWLLRLASQWGRTRREQGHVQWREQYRSISQRITRLDVAVWIWVLLGFVTLIWTSQRNVALTELRVMMIEPLLFYVILRTIQPDQKILLRLVDTLILAGVTVSMVSLLMYFAGSGIIEAEGGARRLAGIYGSPNNIGLFLGRCLPFIVAFVIIKTHPIRRRLMTIALLPVGLALILSQSIGALIIGVPVSVIAVLLLAWGKKAIPVVGVMGGIAVGLFAIAVRLSPRFASLLDFTQGTNFYRLRVWESALNIIRDNPITGLGLDQFLYAFRGQYIIPDAWQEPNLSHPHNFVLDFWIRLGILGVCVFIWIQIIFWRSMYRVLSYTRHANPLLYAVAIGTTGSMINLLAHGLIDNSVFVLDLAYLFVLLLGIASILSEVNAQPNTSAID